VVLLIHQQTTNPANPTAQACPTLVCCTNSTNYIRKFGHMAHNSTHQQLGHLLLTLN